MASHYEMLFCVISRHTDTSESTRVPPEVSTAAREELKARGWTVFEFLGACLATVVRRPAELLTLIEPNRPAPKPKGRPPKSARETFAAAEVQPESRASKAMRGESVKRQSADE